jgi:hypothetical protein
MRQAASKRKKLTTYRYAMFHPLAFLVKLNIEMTMANLIKKVALEKRRNNTCSNLLTLSSDSSERLSVTDVSKSTRRKSTIWLRSIRHSMLPFSRDSQDDGILKTEEFFVQSNTRPNSLASSQVLSQGLVHLTADGPSRSNTSDHNLFVHDVEALPQHDLELSISRTEDLQAYGWIEDENMPRRPEPILRRS